MATRMSVLVSGAVSMILMIIALRAWSEAANLSVNASKPEVAHLAVRSFAVALIALAQAIGLVWVVGKLYPHTLADDLLKLLSFGVTAVALVAALALGLAAR